MQEPVTKLHPAAEWAMARVFTTTEVDCTTTVVLKILDGKCKMLPGEKAAILKIYDVVREEPGEIFSKADHITIDQARTETGINVMAHVHELRVYAESKIPKPIMKKYKAMLREGLFG